MMKNALIVAVLLVAYVAAEEGDECPVLVALKNGIEKCTEALNPTEEMMHDIYTDGAMDDQATNCFRYCMANEAGFMDGPKMDLDKMEEMMKSSSKADPATVEAVMTGMRHCREEAEISDDQCVVAGGYTKCFKALKDAAKAKSAE